MVDIALLEHCLREDLNKRAPRVMARAAAAEGGDRQLSRGPGRGAGRGQQPRRPRAWARARCRSPACSTSSRTTSARTRRRSSSGSAPGQEVRLRYAYLSRCTSVVKDPATGEVVEVHCTYDPATRGGNAPDGRKVKGTIHWVSAAHAVPAEVRLYDHLFTKPDPDDVPEGQDYKVNLNPNSLEAVDRATSSRAWPRPPGEPLPVRAAGLFLRRSRFHGRKAGLQPHGDPGRHLGEDREEGEVGGTCRPSADRYIILRIGSIAVVGQ